MTASTANSAPSVGDDISDADLAQFLKTLAVTYESPVTGNPKLARALKELALSIAKSTRTTRSTTFIRGRKIKGDEMDLSAMVALDEEGLRAFLADTGKTKLQLIDLASARFSIPRSQLKRMTIEEVRAVLRTAILHEGSIEIISLEASRGGEQRRS